MTRREDMSKVRSNMQVPASCLSCARGTVSPPLNLE